MRISDWSSDVCSSDLRRVDRVLDAVRLARREDGTEAIADRSIDQRAGDDADERAEGEDLQRDAEEGRHQVHQPERKQRNESEHQEVAQRVLLKARPHAGQPGAGAVRSEEHTTELPSLMANQYAECRQKQKQKTDT